MAFQIPSSRAAMFGVAVGYKAIADEMLRRLAAASPTPPPLSDIRDAVIAELKSAPVEGLSYEADHEAIKAGLDAVVDYFDSIHAG